ncbi:ferritin-like domain-containing protein [Reyranella sp.]|uniref:ferritin-like domain-containing protein n=1 Tax=Reyranella sp. TaxID=1929291 RepID=UPI001227D5A5|nr:ferritin-like domain-containing protein [Reyranella sp.]TAJ86262.1 MAG: hypothetical protein EPO50_16090 [Reyranella sp.]
MLAELRDDNRQLLSILRQQHRLCEEHGDAATMSLVDGWIGETESRIWFLFESGQASGGHS